MILIHDLGHPQRRWSFAIGAVCASAGFALRGVITGTLRACLREWFGPIKRRTLITAGYRPAYALRGFNIPPDHESAKTRHDATA